MPHHETSILLPNGTHAARFAEPLFHRTPTATGGHRMSEAQVWLSDRVCRWLCPCDCHTSTLPAPQTRDATTTRTGKPVQLELFGSVA